MKIAVFGLGYVGAVTAAILAERGNSVVGIDINPAKVEMIRDGKSPVIEPKLAAIVDRTSGNSSLTAVTDTAQIEDWNIAFICVGTPSGPGGELDSNALAAVIRDIGQQVRQRSDYPIIVMRSTVAPYILQEMVLPGLIQACGNAPGDHYGFVVMPEFLREGSSVKDFYNPPFTLIGESDRRTGEKISELFAFIDAPIVRLSMGEALMVKYSCNAFHALKVVFANEIGMLCALEGLDSHKVMDAFCLDTKLNISADYLKPGFAFGGSCLPKDVRALNHRARKASLDTAVLNAILPSNRSYLEHCIHRVLKTQCKRIGILGISFKTATDDLRESPMITLVEALIGKGKEVLIYDNMVTLAQLTGANRQYIENAIPHIASLIKEDIEDVIEHSEVLVVGNRDKELRVLSAKIRDDQILIDFSKPLPSHSVSTSSLLMS